MRRAFVIADLATTIQIQRLATKPHHAKNMAAETKTEVAQLTLDQWSDCARAGRRESLEARTFCPGSW